MENFYIIVILHLVATFFMGLYAKSGLWGFILSTLLLLLPSTGIWAYYSHNDLTFYIVSALSTILWIVGALALLKYTALFTAIVFILPVVVSLFFREPGGYNLILFAGCLSGYVVVFFLILFANSIGHWSI